MDKDYYCPECNAKLEKISGCGAVAYFCDKCKKLISRQKMLTEDQVKENQDKK